MKRFVILLLAATAAVAFTACCCCDSQNETRGYEKYTVTQAVTISGTNDSLTSPDTLVTTTYTASKTVVGASTSGDSITSPDTIKWPPFPIPDTTVTLTTIP